MIDEYVIDRSTESMDEYIKWIGIDRIHHYIYTHSTLDITDNNIGETMEIKKDVTDRNEIAIDREFEPRYTYKLSSTLQMKFQR